MLSTKPIPIPNKRRFVPLVKRIASSAAEVISGAQRILGAQKKIKTEASVKIPTKPMESSTSRAFSTKINSSNSLEKIPVKESLEELSKILKHDTANKLFAEWQEDEQFCPSWIFELFEEVMKVPIHVTDKPNLETLLSNLTSTGILRLINAAESCETENGNLLIPNYAKHRAFWVAEFFSHVEKKEKDAVKAYVDEKFPYIALARVYQQAEAGDLDAKKCIDFQMEVLPKILVYAQRMGWI